jgi:hypothetical protein
MKFIIVLAYPIAHLILEAFYHYHIFKSSNIYDIKHTRLWHLLDSISKFAMYLLISLLAFGLSAETFIYIVYAACMRILFLKGIFNALIDKPVYHFYVNSHSIDDILGQHPQLYYYGSAILGVAAMILLVIIHLL